MERADLKKDILPRVLHFAPGFRSGGIESLIMGLYRSLDRQKLQFDLIVDTLDELEEFREIREKGGRVFQMGRYLDAPMKYQRGINEILKRFSDNYVAVHCHSVMRAFPVLWAARRFGIRHRILHSHTDSLEGSKQAFLAPIVAPLTSLLSTDFWACSERAGKFFFGDRPVTVFRNAIPVENFAFRQSARSRIRDMWGVDRSAFVLGHTGRFTYQKNHEFLIRVFSEMHKRIGDSYLLLVGEGPLEDRCRALADELGVGDFVIFAGLQKDVGCYLSAMDVFLLPSHFEGFCISLLEAQANGLPCVAADVVPPEVKIAPSLVTYNLNETASNWADLLISLRCEPDRYNSSENIDMVRGAGYDVEFQAQQLIDFYRI